VELYEALKPYVGVQAAQMIADVVPAAEHLATKQDVHMVLAEIRGLEARIFRWGLTFFVPMWAATIALYVDLIRG
jgi:hypothetical protein